MGIKATVVYDVPTHNTIILRTHSVATTERYEVLDTIASFSQHCESLRGVASTVTDVSALWGGPPYVTYNVVNARFRVIIIWDEGPAEFDLSHDVFHALTRLEKAVASVANELIGRATDAVSLVYEEAGYALLGDSPIDLPDATAPPKQRSKLLPIPASTARRSSAAEPKRKKQSGGLLSRINSKLKGSKPPDQPRHKNTPPQQQGSLREPSEAAALSVAPFGSDAAFDDKQGDLVLADEVFAWADFGDPLPEGPGDLGWFTSLIQGGTGVKKRPRAPVLRPGSVPSTPLTIPSSGQPIQGGSETDSLGGSGRISDRQAAVPGTPMLPSPPADSAATSAAASPSQGSTPVQPGTPAQTATSVQTGTPTQSSSASVRQPASSVVPSQGSLPRSGGSVPQSVGSASQSPSARASAAAMQWRASEQTAVMASPVRSGAVPLQPGSASMSTPRMSAMGPQVGSQAATPQSSVASSGAVRAPAPSPATSSIPPALAGQQSEEDFDVSGLGTYKDTAAQSGTRAGRSDVDEAIRGRMNEFAVTMQSGNFRLALQQVSATMRFLAGINPRRDREIVTCSNYLLAQKLLLRNAALEGELAGIAGGTPQAVQRHVECALVTMFLAELKHLLPRHRIAAMKVAVEKNSIVGNYGMCARWLRHLVEKAPPGKKADFANRLQICVRNGERNSHMPATNRLCYNSLHVVGSPYGECGACGAVFHATLGGVVEGQVCGICFVGVVSRKL